MTENQLLKRETIARSVIVQIKRAIKVPFKELKISEGLSFLFFQIGSESYYIKIIG